MPQPFRNAVITDNGAKLLNRAQAGETKIQFTRMKTGNGIYTDDEKTLAALQGQAELKSQKNSFPLSGIEIFTDKSVKVTALITNQDPNTGEALIEAGYYINEIGLYAKEKDAGDETEVLYSIAVTAGENGDYMPIYNGFNPAEIIQEYYVTVNNSAEVVIQKATGAFALADDLQEVISKVQVIEKRIEALEGVGEITETEILEWYGQMGGSTDIPEEDYITEAEIDEMYAANPDYGAGDTGIPDGEIDEMYQENPDYGEGDTGIPDSEIDEMYKEGQA